MPTNTRRSFLKVSGAVIGGIATGTTVTAAKRTDRFIVKTRNTKSPNDLTVVHEMPGVNYAVVRGSKRDVRTSNTVKDYAADIEFSLNQPPINDHAPTVDDTSVTDERFYPFQWDKQFLDIPAAHEITKGEGTRVTIIDSGVAAGHPDLVQAVNEDLSRNFTGDGYGTAKPIGGYHGTHVAGIVAANTANEAGVAGTAPETELVDCRVFPQGDDPASFGAILAAITYSANIGADAANLSVGAYPVSRQGLGNFYGKVLNSITTYANKEGTMLVVSAGNDAADLQHDGNVISLPNEAAQAVSVSATGPIGFNQGGSRLEAPVSSPAIYTNYGTNATTVAAPGGNYDPTQPMGWYFDLILNSVSTPVFDADDDYLGAAHGYSWIAGTSMAAPQVTGAAALLKSVDEKANANQVESTLRGTASVPSGFDKTYYGSGVLDISAALGIPE